jgi:ABC-type oligopeptide transport system substrate-binding subunit
VAGNAYFAEIADSRNRVQAGFTGWSQDYPAASNFFSGLFTCRAFQPATPNNANTSEFCDPLLDTAIDRAQRRQTTDARTASDGTWPAVDRLVTNAAPWVPLVNTREAIVVSRRVGNVQANTEWGVLMDQIWVR